MEVTVEKKHLGVFGSLSQSKLLRAICACALALALAPAVVIEAQAKEAGVQVCSGLDDYGFDRYPAPTGVSYPIDVWIEGFDSYYTDEGAQALGNFTITSSNTTVAEVVLGSGKESNRYNLNCLTAGTTNVSIAYSYTLDEVVYSGVSSYTVNVAPGNSINSFVLEEDTFETEVVLCPLCGTIHPLGDVYGAEIKYTATGSDGSVPTYFIVEHKGLDPQNTPCAYVLQTSSGSDVCVCPYSIGETIITVVATGWNGIAAQDDLSVKVKDAEKKATSYDCSVNVGDQLLLCSTEDTVATVPFKFNDALIMANSYHTGYYDALVAEVSSSDEDILSVEERVVSEEDVWAGSTASVTSYYLKGVSAGSAVVAMKDVTGATYTATVTVVDDSAPTTIAVEGVALDREDATIHGAGTCQLAATVSPEDATNKAVTWLSSDTAVATVDADGRVTAVGRGTATITVTTSDGGYIDACTVYVNNPVVGLEVSASSLNLVKGETASFTVSQVGALPGSIGEGSGVELTYCHGVGFYPVNVVSSEADYFTVSDDAGNVIFSARRIGNADDVTVTWSVTALGTGAGKILLSSDSYFTESNGEIEMIEVPVSITVTNPVKEVAVDQATKTLTVGDGPFSLTATVSPADADDATVAWSSSNTDVAIVDVNGKVTIVAAGSANITATAGGKSATCAVTVKEKQIAATDSEGSGISASVEVSTLEDAEVVEQLLSSVEGGAEVELVVEDPVTLTPQEAAAIESLEAAGGTVVAVVIDAYFAVDGEKVSFNTNGEAEITVRIKMTEEMKALDPDTIVVVFVDDSGVTQVMDTWVEGDDLCFRTSHFSTYAVTGKLADEGDGADSGESGGQPTDKGEDAPAGNQEDAIAKTGDDLGIIAIALSASGLLAMLGLVAARRRMS